MVRVAWFSLGVLASASLGAVIYALGAILYELLTGRPPFGPACATDLLLQVLKSKPESVRRLNPDVDRKLEAICHKCLRKKPASRYQSGWALARDLRSYLDGLSRKRGS